MAGNDKRKGNKSTFLLLIRYNKSVAVFLSFFLFYRLRIRRTLPGNEGFIQHFLGLTFTFTAPQWNGYFTLTYRRW